MMKEEGEDKEESKRQRETGWGGGGIEKTERKTDEGIYVACLSLLIH